MRECAIGIGAIGTRGIEANGLCCIRDGAIEVVLAIIGCGAIAVGHDHGRIALDGFGRVGDRVMAYFGELHPEIVADADLKGPVAAFEVFLDAPPLPKAKTTKARPKLVLSAFQPLERDFAFLVDAGVEAEKLVRAARNADKVMITAARVFDLYAGKGVPEGKKSLAIAVTLQPVERTLTDAEIEAVSEKIVAAVAKATGAVLRG